MQLPLRAKFGLIAAQSKRRGFNAPQNEVAPSANASQIIGTDPGYVAGTWSSGTPTFTRWEKSATGVGSWSTAAATMPNANSAPTDTEFGLYLRPVETNDGVEAAGAAVGPVATATAALTAYWSLEEASGQRNDSVGTSHLTDVNTVLQAAGIQGNAALFASATSERLSSTDNAALSVGDIDFTIATWVRLTTLANAGIVSKWAAGQREYTLFYNHNDHVPNARFTFGVSADGTAAAILDATTFGAPSINTWYFIVVSHSAAGNVTSIQVNNGTADTLSHSGGVFNGTGDFTIGSILGGTFPLNGRIDETALFKSVLTAEQKTWLYNGGAGRSFAEVDALF
jgi:hypothetical protein